MTATPDLPLTCPECSSGKCVNCTRQVLVTEGDQWVMCACPSCGGGIHWATEPVEATR